MANAITHRLMHTTVRLVCDLSDGGTSIGTGFFFSYLVGDGTHYPVIVTNKHVIKGSKKGTFVLTHRNEKETPILGSFETVEIVDFESQWIKHPEANVDIAILPLGPILDRIKEAGSLVSIAPLDDSMIPTPEVLVGLSVIEEITMVGYPNGIWDSHNNMPIARRGITATSPTYDYCGLPWFVIDCACFPGSSGSPVLALNQREYNSTSSRTINEGRLLLLGVMFAGPQHEVQGKIKIVDLPFNKGPISLSMIPTNLGFVVKSQKLHDFKAILISGIKPI